MKEGLGEGGGGGGVAEEGMEDDRKGVATGVGGGDLDRRGTDETGRATFSSGRLNSLGSIEIVDFVGSTLFLLTPRGLDGLLGGVDEEGGEIGSLVDDDGWGERKGRWMRGVGGGTDDASVDLDFSDSDPMSFDLLTASTIAVMNGTGLG